jgi:hypothetical protein
VQTVFLPDRLFVHGAAALIHGQCPRKEEFSTSNAIYSMPTQGGVLHIERDMLGYS